MIIQRLIFNSLLQQMKYTEVNLVEDLRRTLYAIPVGKEEEWWNDMIGVERGGNFKGYDDKRWIYLLRDNNKKLYIQEE